MPWKAIACSEKGTSHEKIGSPCQDYADFIRVNDSGDADNKGDIVIGAVSDGAGSCKYSDIGSKLAVETTLQFLQGWLQWLKHQQKKDLSQPISSEYVRQIFDQNLVKLQKAFKATAEEMFCSSKDFSCTLLVVVATPKWLAAMQIGDGFIVIRQPDSEYQLLFQPIKGEYANETTFITASNALEKMQVTVVAGEQNFIFISTDGLEKLAVEIRKESKAYQPFFKNFEEAIKIRSEAEEKISTQKFLQSEEVNKRTDDDKTILLCWYESAFQYQPPNKESKPSASVHTQTTSITTFKSSGGDTQKYPPPTPAPPPSVDVITTSLTTPVPQPSRGATPKPEPSPETQLSGVSESEAPQYKLVGKAGEQEDYSLDFYAFVINVLAGIFWNSLWYDLFFDIRFSSSDVRNVVGLFLAVILTVLIFLVNWHIYQQKLKSSKTLSTNPVNLFRYMFIIYVVGLGVGGLSYFVIRKALWYFSR